MFLHFIVVAALLAPAGARTAPACTTAIVASRLAACTQAAYERAARATPDYSSSRREPLLARIQQPLRADRVFTQLRQ
jgi:hypothetical protein